MQPVPTHSVLIGDCLSELRSLPDQSVHCCVTSPLYFGLRDYGHAGQIGLEKSPEQYISRLADVFHEVRRVLRDDGTVWLNLGDSYANDGKWGGSSGGKHVAALHGRTGIGRGKVSTGLKPKDLMGIPWRVAMALQEPWLLCSACGFECHASRWGRMPEGDRICPECHQVESKVAEPGWYLRQDVIWHKKNPMPESVRDRCTKAHEYLFLLTKSPKYYFDHEAIREPASDDAASVARRKRADNSTVGTKAISGTRFGQSGMGLNVNSLAATRNRRSVWSVASRPYKGAHFATFPPQLIEPCILAGCPEGGVVLDPFGGSGTTAGVSQALGRSSVIIELNPDSARLVEDRKADIARYFEKRAAL